MSIFKGSCVALSTPFNEEGINFEVLKQLLDFQLTSGTDAILVCGTTGEPSTMTHEEKLSVINFTVKHVAKRVPVIAGVGSNHTAKSVELAEEARDLGADALLVVTPYYNKCSAEGLKKHCFAIADAGKLPVILYNVPSRTGFNITPNALLQLSENEYICGIKEASANITQIVEMARLCRNRIDIYSGNDDHVLPIMSVGGLGVISVTANVAPRLVKDMAHAYLTGDMEKAIHLQLRLNALTCALFCEVNPIPVKTALRFMGFDMGELRMPLCEMEECHLEILKKAMKDFGLIL